MDYERVYQLVLEMAEAIRYLCSRNIIHRYLKVQNVMIDQHKVKIVDFGLSAQLKCKEEMRTSRCGTPRTMAPEIVKNECYNHKVDCYALGIIIQQMMDYFEQNVIIKQFDTSSFNKQGSKEHIIYILLFLSLKITITLLAAF